MGWFVDWFLNSSGIKRRLASLFQVIATVILQVPVLAPYAHILNLIASWLGLAGITHAVGSSVVASGYTDSKDLSLATSPLSTLAAFFAALELALANVPVLMPYQGLIHVLSVFFAMLATGSVVGGGNG